MHSQTKKITKQKLHPESKVVFQGRGHASVGRGPKKTLQSMLAGFLRRHHNVKRPDSGQGVRNKTEKDGESLYIIRILFFRIRISNDIAILAASFWRSSNFPAKSPLLSST